VFVKEYNSQRVTIEGAVRKPGIYPVTGGMSLIQAIATAQGFSEAADESVVVFRESGGKRQVARFELSDIRAGKAEDVQLEPGDVIVAGRSALKENWNTFLKAIPAAGLFALL